MVADVVAEVSVGLLDRRHRLGLALAAEDLDELLAGGEGHYLPHEREHRYREPLPPGPGVGPHADLVIDPHAAHTVPGAAVVLSEKGGRGEVQAPPVAPEPAEGGP